MKKKSKVKLTKTMPKKKAVFKKAIAKKAAAKKPIAKKATSKKRPEKKTKASAEPKKSVKVSQSNKSVSKKSDALPPIDLSNFNAKEFIKKMESAYDVTLPNVYTKFLMDGKFENYRKMDMTGFVTGPYFLDFIDENLSNAEELGMDSGIFDMDDCNWFEDYADFVPVASMYHPALKEGAKGFLVINVTQETAPVLLFDYEGWTLYPVADSFQKFLTDLPAAKNDMSKSFRLWDVKEDETEEEKTYWTIEREELEEGKHKDIWENSFEKKKTDLLGTIKDLIGLLKFYPKNTFLIRSIVSLSLQNNDTKSAHEYIEKGLKLKPNCLFLLEDLANQKILAGDLDNALKIANQIEIGMDTSDDEEEYNLSGIKAIRGLVYYKQGKKDEALKLLEEADDLSFLASINFDGFDEALKDLRKK